MTSPSGMTLAGASFTKAIASNFFPSFADLLLGYYFGPDAPSSQKNVKAGSAFPTSTLSATVPTYGAAYADVSNSAGKYFDSGSNYFGPFTACYVMDAADAGGQSRLHGTGPQVGNNALLQISGTGKKVDVMINNIVRSTGTVVHPGTLNTEFVFVGFAYDMLNWKVFQKSTSLGYTSQTGTFAFPSSSWGNWRVAGVSVVGDAHRIAAHGLYSRYMSDVEIQKMATVLSFNMTKRGLTALF